MGEAGASVRSIEDAAAAQAVHLTFEQQMSTFLQQKHDL
jgi:hypothetical protein